MKIVVCNKNEIFINTIMCSANISTGCLTTKLYAICVTRSSQISSQIDEKLFLHINSFTLRHKSHVVVILA